MPPKTMLGLIAKDGSGDGRNKNFTKNVGRELGYEKPLKSKKQKRSIFN